MGFGLLNLLIFMVLGPGGLFLLWWDVGGVFSALNIVYYSLAGLNEDGHKHGANRIMYEQCADAMNKPVHYRSQVPYDWAKLLRDNYEMIKEEVLDSINFPMVSMADFDDGNKVLGSKHMWRVVYFINNGYVSEVAKERFPKTMELLRKTPLVSAFISNIEGGSNLHFHRGPLNGVLRYHLGLDIPEPGPDDDPDDRPFLLVLSDNKNQTYWERGMDCAGLSCDDNDCIERRYRDMVRASSNKQRANGSPGAGGDDEDQREAYRLTWSDGDDLIFDDMFEHAVVNKSPRRRVVLFADYVREDCPPAVYWILWFGLRWWLPYFSPRVRTTMNRVHSFDYQYYIDLFEAEEEKAELLQRQQDEKDAEEEQEEEQQQQEL